jgi:hypothetical protein
MRKDSETGSNNWILTTDRALAAARTDHKVARR